MESILLLVNSAPSTPNAERAFQTALTLRAQGHAVSLFLIQDAVLGGLYTENEGTLALVMPLLKAGALVYALGEDLAMRGFTALKLWEGIRVADYAQLVDLVDQHTRVIGAL